MLPVSESGWRENPNPEVGSTLTNSRRARGVSGAHQEKRERQGPEATRKRFGDAFCRKLQLFPLLDHFGPVTARTFCATADRRITVQ